MVITSKGQVTIPQKFREMLGLLPDTEIEFVIDGDSLKIKKIRESHRRGQALIARMTGRATAALTTDEIMALTRGER